VGAVFISKLNGEVKSNEINIFQKLVISCLQENQKREIWRKFSDIIVENRICLWWLILILQIMR
jgi:hypothetical protein